MSSCRNVRTVDYSKLVAEIESASANKTYWADTIVSVIDADYSIKINCAVTRTLNPLSQKLVIHSDYAVFDKLSGQPTLAIEFEPETLINLFNI